jgi:hypothetical protein
MATILATKTTRTTTKTLAKTPTKTIKSPNKDNEDVGNNEDENQHNEEIDDDDASMEETQHNGPTEEPEGAFEDGADETEEPQRSAQAHTYNLRGNKRDYSHRLANTMNDPASSKRYNAQFLQQPAEDQDTRRVYGQQFLQHAIETIDGSPKKAYEYICEFMFNQMTADAGIKKHGRTDGRICTTRRFECF